MTSKTKKIIAGGIVGLAIAGGGLALAPNAETGTEPIGIIVDMPESNPESIKSRLQLLIAGGANPRDIYVTYSERTHQDNLFVINSHPNVVKKIMVNDLSKTELEKSVKSQLGTKGTRYLYAREEQRNEK